MRLQLTLYSKPGCHLCEEVRALLDTMQPTLACDVEEIDITTDPALFARYRYEIPVLASPAGEIARGRIDEAELWRRLRDAQRGRGGGAG